jgi:diguanylate cyclase (GGDEF)-like protein/PAS domain S-box-containing protein
MMDDIQEPNRIMELKKPQISASENAFEHIVHLAAQIFDVPIVLINIPDDPHNQFQAYYGPNLQEGSGNNSFFVHPMKTSEVTVVNDATLDPQFSNDSLVTAYPHIRFYAGAPLRKQDGHVLGTLCIIDTQPRYDIDEKEKTVLSYLAQLAVNEFELRFKSLELQKAHTKQNLIAKRLRESQQELQLILASTPDVVASFDSNLQYAYINPTIDRYVNIKTDSFRGKTNEELGLPLHLAELWNNALGTVLETRRYGELEFNVMTDHGPIYFQTKMVPKIDNGIVERIVTVTRDVTAMKLAQLEFENFFELSQDLLIIANPQAQAKRVNSSWYNGLGYSLEDLGEASLFSYVHPDDMITTQQAFEQIKEGKQIKNFEHRFQHKGGSYRWLQWSAQFLTQQNVIFAIARDITEEKLRTLALQQSEERFRALFDTASVGIMLTDSAGFIQQANAVAKKLFGYDEDDLHLQTIMDLIPNLPPEVFLSAEKAPANNFLLELSGCRKHGESFPIEVSLNYLHDLNDTIIVLFMADRTERKRQEHTDRYRAETLELIAKRTPLKTILSHLVTILETNYPDLKTVIHVKRAEHLIMAYSSPLPLDFAKTITTLPLDGSRTTISLTLASKQAVYIEDIQEHTLWANFPLEAFKSCWSYPIKNEEDNVYGVISLFSETSQSPKLDQIKLLSEVSQLAALDLSQRRLLAQLEHQSLYDPVTGLGNRRFMHERLEHQMMLCEQNQEALAVVVLDIDNFKIINESYGHATGDTLLKAVARRLKTTLRTTDTITRLGEDEFGLILPLLPNQDSSFMIKKLLRVMAQPFLLNDHSFDITVSIGVSLYPDHAQSSDELLKFADSALSVVKDEGKKTYRYYQASMMQQLSDRIELRGDLKRALSGAEFVLYFQPRVQTETGQILAAEALLRWQHPKRGFLSPATFLGVAEKSNLMPVLDTWVLRESCRHLRRWQDQGLPYRLSCNISGDSFKDDAFADKLIALLQKEGIDPYRLELEITENTLLKHPQRAATQLTKLKETLIGLRIAIDDFGTGYSSLAYLRHLPVDTLKIDRLFVRDLDQVDQHQRQTARAVINTIISLGHQLNLQVIAEGAETEAQIQTLSQLGCNEVQGYVFSKPLGLEAFIELVGRGVHHLKGM